MAEENSSGTNTVLIVIVLLILVGFGVWWFTNRGVPADNGPGADINITLPAGGGNSNPPGGVAQ